ncbi:hypothetical protein HJG60_008216 [Phyllostomus discolor]|uniref:Uncharacterized protein n=1 Tax=Phyllostomus discolor TaxID=89673 RepID=A0A834DPA1_9CHIR|nr:hypothetical protein HJG60_008216 [Phyllostomus discolor]
MGFLYHHEPLDKINAHPKSLWYSGTWGRHAQRSVFTINKDPGYLKMATLRFEGDGEEGGGEGGRRKGGGGESEGGGRKEGEEMKGLTQEKYPLFQVDLEHAKVNETLESARRPRPEQALSLPHCVIVNTSLCTHSDLTAFLIK